jgi:hypothetical protein
MNRGAWQLRNAKAARQETIGRIRSGHCFSDGSRMLNSEQFRHLGALEEAVLRIL